VKTITLLAVAAILLVDVFGSKSSVGGPMTDLLVSFIIMLAVGLYEAWGRGPLGWIVNVFLAVIGGLVALSLMSIALETVMTAIHFEGKLATSHHPLRYIVDVVMPISTVLGSWIAIQFVHRTASLIANSGIFTASVDALADVTQDFYELGGFHIACPPTPLTPLRESSRRKNAPRLRGGG
jgi:hypothetical protein